MRFAVDGMLGGLARWLRILGHTVAYERDFNDNQLLTMAATQEMTLLTRDEELYKRAVSKRVPSLLVPGRTETERLAHVSANLGVALKIEMEKTLCPECGHGLAEAPKNDLHDLVPAASLLLYDQFWRCTNPGCGKIYWMGSHWKQINQTLTKARQLVGLKE